jgi:hypothetical protein
MGAIYPAGSGVDLGEMAPAKSILLGDRKHLKRCYPIFRWFIKGGSNIFHGATHMRNNLCMADV